MDVNWSFLREDVPEIAAVRQLVAGRTFACILDLHEDWESAGYYLYEQFRGRSIGFEITENVRTVCPVDDRSRIEGEAAVRGVIHPDMEIPKRKGGEGVPISMFRKGHTDRMITAESPSAFDLQTRVAGHLAAIETTLELHRRG